jgi:DNA-binding MarR family transcriptional regulator
MEESVSEKKLEKQVTELDRAIHKLVHLLFSHGHNPENSSEAVVMSGGLHIIEMAYKNPDMILKEFREYFNLPQTTLSSKIAKLEKMGLIKRVINTRDMRSFSLEVTAEGEKLYKEHKELDRYLAKEGLLALDDNERDLFINMLNKAVKRFSK